MSEVPPEVYLEDETIWPIMVRLQQCLCEEIERRGLMPGNCFCGILPGDTPSWDYDTGMAWVRLIDVYPSTTFPNADTSLRNCVSGLAATLEIGILQCAPGLGAGGELPTQADNFESARLQLAGMRAMQQAIACCDLDPLVVGSYTPLGPQGGLVGGIWQINVGAD